jgi:hypothetical protein
MYLYLAQDGKTLTPVALMPTTRGRPAKNHEKIEVRDFDFGVAVSKDAAIKTKTTAGTIKAEIVAGVLETVENTASANSVLRHLATAICKMLATTIPRMSVPTGVQKQLDAVHKALAGQILSTDVNDADGVKAVVEILKANHRMLNGLLSADPENNGWCHLDAAASTGATTATATAPEAEKDSDETLETTGTDEDMSTATVNFGFNKLIGEKAQLRLAEEPATKDAAGVFNPKPDETYIIDEQVGQLFKILQISRKNCPQNVNLVGPHGCGKTELAIQFAARLNLPLLIMDCANLREARDWFGYKSAKDGTVFWHESQFVKAVEAGNHVILLDELNRANPHLLNTLMPLLDARRFTYLEEKGDKICVGPGTVFFASMNEGAGYTGTSALDRAIRDRFPRVVELTYLGEKDEIRLLVNRVGISEEIATRLVGMANKIRQDATGLSAALTESMSTRQLIAAAHDFAIGGVETLTFTISNHFSADGDDDSERVRVQNIIQGKFGDLLAASAEKKRA